MYFYNTNIIKKDGDKKCLKEHFGLMVDVQTNSV